MAKKNIGIFGGSFNPIHIGHLVIAEAAWQQFNLEKVVFIPTNDTPGKSMHHINKYDRYHMVELAIKGNPRFTISPIERDTEGTSYTVFTIERLKKLWGGRYNFYFIGGTDAVADLPNWKYNCELLQNCYFISASRVGHEKQLEQTISYFGQLGKDKILKLKIPELDISSTILREWLSKGISVRYLMCPEVIRYIHEKKLYRGKDL